MEWIGFRIIIVLLQEHFQLVMITPSLAYPDFLSKCIDCYGWNCLIGLLFASLIARSV
jgi:hypothetical protein